MSDWATRRLAAGKGYLRPRKFKKLVKKKWKSLLDLQTEMEKELQREGLEPIPERSFYRMADGIASIDFFYAEMLAAMLEANLLEFYKPDPTINQPVVIDKLFEREKQLEILKKEIVGKRKKEENAVDKSFIDIVYDEYLAHYMNYVIKNPSRICVGGSLAVLLQNSSYNLHTYGRVDIRIDDWPEGIDEIPFQTYWSFELFENFRWFYYGDITVNRKTEHIELYEYWTQYSDSARMVHDQDGYKFAFLTWLGKRPAAFIVRAWYPCKISFNHREEFRNLDVNLLPNRDYVVFPIQEHQMRAANKYLGSEEYLKNHPNHIKKLRPRIGLMAK